VALLTRGFECGRSPTACVRPQEEHLPLHRIDCKLLRYLVTQSARFRYPRSCLRSNRL
jgi:hypothetical protein